MNTKPINDETLKTILRYMDPIRRFDLSTRFPSIRALEKKVPLYLDELEFYISIQDTTFIRVNSTTYQTGVYKDYGENKVTEETHKENSEGGFGRDFDRFGLTDNSVHSMLTDGDVVIGDPASRDYLYDLNDEDIDAQLAELQTLKWIFEKKLKGETVVIDENDKIKQEIEPYFNNTAVFRQVIDENEDYLMPFLNRRFNINRPFTTTALLTVKCKGETIHSKHYNMKLHELQKFLTTEFFGGRKSIYVKKFKISCTDGVLRLPAGIKFKIHTFVIASAAESIYKVMDEFVDESSYPLKCLKIRKCRKDEQELENRHVKEAEELLIYEAYFARRNYNLVDYDLPNPKITLLTRTIFAFDAIELIKKWLKNPPQIGASYTFGFQKQIQCVTCFNAIRKTFKVTGDSSFKIPMNEYAAIQVSFFHSEELDELEKRYKSSWFLKNEVVQA